MRLIDADALLKSFDVAWMVEYDEIGCGITREAIPVKAIEEAPAIEAVPVRHGRWIDGMPYTNSHWKVCSVCHKSADHPAGGHEYCGHCGAKMDGDADGQTG